MKFSVFGQQHFITEAPQLLSAINLSGISVQTLDRLSKRPQHLADWRFSKMDVGMFIVHLSTNRLNLFPKTRTSHAWFINFYT
ncbi:uncharacterized protein ARMOST_19341 [Armillaria ostoyae]|uniref:Uncharacterized protein n=1 Tax=Armillaria ostoyae TaxID=47428 RepID=A0A284S4E0_ARMOS|nr:uncharacterized protein ARMOST_19341 [Armillaria ostoyae]